MKETECTYEDVTMDQFNQWINNHPEDGNPLKKYPRAAFSCYIDYKYMKDLFKGSEYVFDQGVCILYNYIHLRNNFFLSGNVFFKVELLYF